jgi:hypothetical protein
MPTVTPIHIDQLDLGAIARNNLLNQSQQLQNNQAIRQDNALNTYGQAINSGQAPDQAANAMRSMDPVMADKLQSNALALQSSKAAMSRDMDQFIQARVPLAKDQQSWDSVLGEAAARYGIQIPDALKTYTPQLQQQLLLGGLSAAQQIANQRQNATASALGLPAGVDPSTYAGAAHTINTEGRAQQMFPLQMQQTQGNIANTQSEIQKRDAMFPMQMENYQSEIDLRKRNAGKQQMITIPDPNDALGIRKVPAYIDPVTNSAVPFQTTPKDEQGAPQGGQAQQQTAQQMSPFKSPAEVKAAYQEKKITRDQAKAILNQQFGMQ